MKMESVKEGAIVRLSIAHFKPEQTDKVESMLNNEFKNHVAPAIKRLRGHIAFYVGIDKEKLTMSNVSFWETKEDALQMGTLKEMADMRATFKALGIEFNEMTNHDILWMLRRIDPLKLSFMEH